MYLVEDVVVALGVGELDNPGALQQVGPDSSPADAPSLVELDLHKLPESRRVVVPHRLGVAKRLQQRIGLQHLRRRRCVMFTHMYAHGHAHTAEGTAGACFILPEQKLQPSVESPLLVQDAALQD